MRQFLKHDILQLGFKGPTSIFVSVVDVVALSTSQLSPSSAANSLQYTKYTKYTGIIFKKVYVSVLGCRNNCHQRCLLLKWWISITLTPSPFYDKASFTSKAWLGLTFKTFNEKFLLSPSA